MKYKATPEIHTCRHLNVAVLAGLLLVSLLFSTTVKAINTKTATTTGNWSNASIWSPSGVPKDTDNIIINSGITVTVDGDYICRNLSIGSSTASATSLKIITAGNSLTVNGDLDFNVSNKSAAYLIDAGPGDITFAGTFSHWSTSGTDKFQVGTGSISYTPAVSITSSTQSIVFTGGGTVNFNSNFSDAQNKMTFYTGCTVNFHGNYTISGTNVTWGGMGTANFYGTGTITDTKNITLNTANIISGATTTLAAGGGAFVVAGNLTINSSAAFNMNDNFQLNGSFTNNGTFSAGAVTLTLMGLGTTQTITGSSSLTLPAVQIGNGNGADISVIIAQNTTVSSLAYSAGDHNRSVSINSGKTLTVSGNVTMAQETKDNMVALLSVGAGSCTINGNLVFSGTNNGITRVCKVNVTSGTFTLAGTLTWLSNSAVATEVVSCSTGTLNFSSSISMGSGSGTIAVTSSGTINFNGTSAPSLTFGGSTAPSLSTAYGSTIKLAKGMTTNTTALTFTNGSTVIINGTGTVTPNATLTFANLSISSSCTLTAAGNFYVKGNWSNSGTFTPSTYTVTFNGSGNHTISRSGGETFYKLTLTPFGSTITMQSDVLVTNTFGMSGANLNMNGYTLTLGNNAGAALTYSAGTAYGGTFKRWFPASAITSNSGSYYGLFPIGTSDYYRPIGINTTVSPTTAGYVMASHTDGSGGVNVTYTDNEGSNIQQIANQHSDITTSGLVGGTYNIDVKFSALGSQGSVSNCKLETHTGGTMGSCGTHATTLGPVGAPTAKRTGVTMANLSNTWVIGTNDRNSSPLYTYVYSRKSGNWNDNSATGTWSYTAGGAGAACSCLPTSGGYAVINPGHTVTVTATDTVQFLDVDSAAALTINSGKTFNVTANMDMYRTGTFTNNGVLNVTGELLLSSPTSPTVNGNVNVYGWFTLSVGAAYTQSTGTVTVNGDMELSGAMSCSSGTSLVFNGTSAHLSGTGGTFTTASGGSFTITNDKTIDASTSITIGTSGTNTALAIATGTTVDNLGAITVNGNLTGADASATWINNANSSLSVTGTVLSTGNFDVATAPNTVNYSGSGSQNVKIPVESYHTLVASNGGTKSLVGDVIVDSVLTLGGTVLLDESSYILYGDADLRMSGTSELRMTRATDVDIYPELRGIYTCTGGTVTINQTGDSAVVSPGPYYNLKLNGTKGYDLGAVSNITNNLDVSNSAYVNDNSVLTVGGTFTYSSSAATSLTDSIAVNGISITAGSINDGGNSINVTGAGGWTLNSGATFTPTTGTVYFTGTSNQTLGGTTVTQSFNSLCVNKNSNTMTVGGSTTTLSIAGDVMLNAGVFDKGTAANINMTGGSWNNNGGSFTAGSGTVTFNSTAVDQAIQGSATAETFNNLVVNKSGYTLAIGDSMLTLNINGNATLTAGTFDAGSASDIKMTAGNWVNNGATFTPGTSNVTFNGTGAQAINGTAASQTFYKLTVNKSSGTLSVGGSTTSLTINSDMTLAAGTFDKGTATNIYAGGNWTNNGGTFTYGAGTVTCNSGVSQAINGTATTQTFYNLTVNKSSNNLSISGSTGVVTVNNTLTLTSGLIVTGSNKIAIPTTATVSGAGAGKYIYGNEQIYIPNASAPSRTFDIGDATIYAPVTLAFVGTTSGSGSITISTTAGDDAAIASSGINSAKSVNRTWDVRNSSVGGFTLYSATYNFDATDIDAGASTASFEIRRLTGGTWYSTAAGSRTSTSTQCTGETAFGKAQIGEKSTLTVTTQPTDVSGCSGTGTSFTSASTSTPTPTVQWQRDPNTGTFADITGGMDGGVYSNFATTTLNISDVSSLNNYKYRAVFTNINGSVNSNQATLTVNTTPTISSVAGGSHCSSGTVDLAATSSGGTINWYAASSGGGSLGSGPNFTTPGISSTTTYYVDATSGACTTGSRTAVTATINSIPTITGTTAGSHCSTGTVDLAATSSAGTINWYAASSGGASLAAGTTFTTPSISSTTTYYVDATASGCTTGSRTAVTATINPIPTITGTTDGAHCSTGTVDLAATSSSGTVNWYSASSGGSSLSSGNTFTTPSISSTTTYYADATASGCTTGSRTPVTATINSIPTITGTTAGSHCSTGTVDLAATSSAGTISWYAASSGGASLHSGGTFTTPSISTTTTYYVDATANSCTTGSRTAVTATINPTPVASVTYQSCPGVDGNTTIKIGGSGGTGPYTYKLNSGSFNSVDTVHIANASTQNFYVQDAFGCTSAPDTFVATSVTATQIPTSIGTTSCSCPSLAEGRDVYLTNASGDLIAVINDMGHNLGTITATVYVHGSPVIVNTNQGGTEAAMGRNFVLHFTGTNLTPNVEVKFPYTTTEYSDLVTAAVATPTALDDLNTAADLGSTQYEGPDEDSIYNTSGATMLVYHRQLGNGNLLNGKFVKIGLAANGEHWLHGNGDGSALPIKLVSFDAVARQQTQMVQTSWVTDMEINNNYFTVERSGDGINFNEVGRVQGAGNSTAMLNYRFNDTKPLFGISYYRLKQTDFDGHFSYSNIVPVTMGEQTAFHLHPNPTNGQIFLTISNPSNDINVIIYDLNGQQLFQRMYQGESFNQEQLITLQAKYLLPAGMYLVGVTTNGTEFKQKLVIE